MIFQRLSEHPHGFGELRRAMPRVTTKVLREQLRQMTADDLVMCEPLSPKRLGVRYAVTPYGQSLGPVFEALWRWGTRHLARRDAHRGTMAKPPVGSVGSDPTARRLKALSRSGVGSDPT